MEEDLDIPHFRAYLPDSLRSQLLEDIAVRRGGVGIVRYSVEEHAQGVEEVKCTEVLFSMRIFGMMLKSCQLESSWPTSWKLKTASCLFVSSMSASKSTSVVFLNNEKRIADLSMLKRHARLNSTAQLDQNQALFRFVK